ncbi:unnamed protein product [Ectocarpus sp. CCAP 1310/34]|nr:unnamed protein product [Ectocarpus sp. CCAP 1310/34]
MLVAEAVVAAATAAAAVRCRPLRHAKSRTHGEQPSLSSSSTSSPFYYRDCFKLQAV